MQKQEAEKHFEQMIGEHEQLLYKVCHVYAYTDADRQDLFQEIVLQLWKAFPNFKGNAAISTWMYRVAINTAITGLRKKKDHISSREPSQLPERIDDNSEQQDEQLEELYRAIGQLGEVEKAIVMLYMEDHTYEEMENILGMSQGALRVRMNRVKDKLRQLTKK